MTPLEERVLIAQQDSAVRDTLLKEYQNFILSAAQKNVHRFVTVEDDEWSVALSAFNDAITKYEEPKGRFLSFASLLIKNALIDYYRSSGRHEQSVNFSALSSFDDRGEEQAFDIATPNEPISDARWEIEAITAALSHYHISFFDLPKDTPKAEKTRKACQHVFAHILSHPDIKEAVLKSGNLPISRLIEAPGISRKLLERHRKYIIAGVVILSGDYPIIASYIPHKEVES